MIVYVVVYDEPDEPSEVLAAFDTRETADALVDGTDTLYVEEVELNVAPPQ